MTFGTITHYRGATVLFRAGPARYAKVMMAVRCPPFVDDRDTGWKTRAARICEGLKGRWSNRERAYIMSRTKVRRLGELLAAGADWSPITRKWETPPPKAD